MGASYTLTSLAHSLSKSESTFFQGLLHPLTGLDHLLAMILIGLCIGIYTQRYLTSIATILASLTIGMTFVGFYPIQELAIETGVICSLLALGLSIMQKLRLSQGCFLIFACTFALFHGFAHIADQSANGQLDLIIKIPYMIGVIVCTGGLLTLGLSLSKLHKYSLPSYSKITGILTISFGGILLAQLISK